MRPRRERPLFIIDIAVPRDVEPAAGDLEQVFLYNIDDLQGIVRENLARRSAELARAEAIVDEEAAQVRRLAAVARDHPDGRRAAPALRGDPPRRAAAPGAQARPACRPRRSARVDEITRLIVEKLLLTPTEQLKAVSDDALAATYSDALNRLFSLPASDAEPTDDEPRRTATRRPP